MDYGTLIGEVRRHAKLSSPAETEQAVRMALRALRQVLPAPDAQRLQVAVPPELAAELTDDLGESPESDAMIDKEVFVGPLVNSLETEASYDHTLGGLDLVSVHSGDEASRRIQAVFAVLKSGIDRELAARLGQTLPGEVADWWRDARPQLT